MTDALVWVFAAIAVIEGVGLTACCTLLIRSRRETDYLRRAADHPPALAARGGSEMVKTLWDPQVSSSRQGSELPVRGSIEQLADWAEAEGPDLSWLARQRITVIMFSDIENSTALNERLGDRAWVWLIGRHDQLIRKLVKKHSGHVVKSQVTDSWWRSHTQTRLCGAALPSSAHPPAA